MNQVVKSEIENMRQTLNKMRPQFALALPAHLTADRLCRVAMTAITNNPDLLKCDKTSLISAVMTCAQLGLEPDGVLGQAYLVPYKNKVQFIPGYRGLITLARNSGEIEAIWAEEVRQNDRFDFDKADNRISHTHDLYNERGEVIAFYAAARFKAGGKQFVIMTVPEVKKVREASKAKSGPWFAHFNEMGKKTAIRRLVKMLPIDVQKLHTAAAMEDLAESGVTSYMQDDSGIIIDQEGRPQDKAGSLDDLVAEPIQEEQVDKAATEQESNKPDPADEELRLQKESQKVRERAGLAELV